MSQKDNLSTVLDQVIRNRLAELQTAAPAEIVSYDYQTQKASVQPTINRVYKDGYVSKYPLINNVPVIFPRSGGASLTFPVKPGDTVLLVFAARCLDDWLSRGGIVNQSDPRMHNINDAIAIPGLLPFSLGSMAKNNEDVLLTYVGCEVEIKQDTTVNVRNPEGDFQIAPSGKITINSPTEVEFNTPMFRVNANNITFGGEGATGQMIGSLIVTGEISDHNNADGTLGLLRDTYNDHTHNETQSVTQEPNEQVP